MRRWPTAARQSLTGMRRPDHQPARQDGVDHRERADGDLTGFGAIFGGGPGLDALAWTHERASRTGGGIKMGFCLIGGVRVTAPTRAASCRSTPPGGRAHLGSTTGRGAAPVRRRGRHAPRVDPRRRGRLRHDGDEAAARGGSAVVGDGAHRRGRPADDCAPGHSAGRGHTRSGVPGAPAPRWAARPRSGSSVAAPTSGPRIGLDVARRCGARSSRLLRRRRAARRPPAHSLPPPKPRPPPPTPNPARRRSGEAALRSPRAPLLSGESPPGARRRPAGRAGQPYQWGGGAQLRRRWRSCPPGSSAAS